MSDQSDSMPRVVPEGSGDRIGEAVRSLREQQGLSVRTLAKRSGFSPSFISQVEHGLASPSIGSMEKIAFALGISLSGFFAIPVGTTDSPVVIRAGEGRGLTSEWSQATIQALGTSWYGDRLDPVLMTLAPGGRSGADLVEHQGEGFAYVLEGAVQLHLTVDSRQLSSGDAIHLPPFLPHRWENVDAEQVKVLLVSLKEPLA